MRNSGAAGRAKKRAFGLLLLFALALQSLDVHAQSRTRFAPDAEVREAFEPLIEKARAAVVTLQLDDERSVLGTLVDERGHLLTKASELDGEKEIVARLSDGRRVRAKLVTIDRMNDLAVLRVDATRLRPVKLVQGTPAIGRWLASVGSDRSPVAVGIVSARSRTIKPPQLVLGVILREDPRGLRVLGLSEDFGAAKAGIRVGDVLTHIGDKKVLAVQQVINRLQGQAEGDEVTVSFLRGDQEMEAGITLSELEPDPRSRAERMNRMGGDISERRRGFEKVLQHDAEIRPEHCGGPIVNLKGQVVGINIARAGRIATYALPSALLNEKLGELRRGALGNGRAAEPVNARESE